MIIKKLNDRIDYLKKTHLSRTTVVTLVAFLFSSCSTFLDEVPDNRVALDDLDKAAQLLTSAYSIASPAFTDWMTDDSDWIDGTTKRPSQQQIFRWEEVTNGGPDEQDTPDFFWFETYAAIAHANEVLAIIDELPIETEEEMAKYRAVRSEALLTRAYGHFMMVLMFAPEFRFSPASDGIPYIKAPETTFLQEYTRKSVRRVYDDVEDDLLEGLELVDDSFFSNSGKYHFNRNAALAFASRFYLYKGEYSESLIYSNELLGSNPSAFVRDMGSDEFQEARSSITRYPQVYSSPEEASNLLLMRKISLVQRTDFAFGPTTQIYNGIFDANLFDETTDQRDNPALVKGLNGSFPLRYESLFQRSSLNSNTGTPYHISIAFRGEEVLLNRAEASVFTGDIDQAVEDLLTLSRKRYIGASLDLSIERIRRFFGAEDDPGFTDADAVLNYLLLEKRKEFIAQGMRWFDIKRYNLEVSHFFPETGQQQVLERNDPRKILQIPRSAQDVGGLEPNDR